MSSYVVQTDDTFTVISRKSYGTDEHAGLIAKANPGTLEPLIPGSTLIVPPRPGAPTDKLTQAPSTEVNEVAVLIKGERFRFWSELKLIRSLDGVAAISFRAPFDASIPGFKSAFRPFSYHPLVVTVGGEPLFTGTLVDVVPNLDSRSKTIQCAGYSVPGVHGDCTPPASAFPLEFNKQALPEIAQTLADPFGITVEFTGKPGPTFERVEINPGDDITGFLADLARQRSLVVSDTPDGKLLFQQSVATGSPVAQLRQGASPVMGVSPSFSPQKYYSHITGLESVTTGTDGSQFTAKNPHLTDVLRPHTFKSPDVEGGDIKTAVNAKLGRMFGNMAAYTVKVDTWRDPAGELWTPNTTVVLEAADAMIYSPYEFVIRSVSYERDGAKEAAELTLVLPGAFSGQVPEILPWD